ncbi:ATP synthase subunit I [Salisediminibacterium selenitireducens]|uniref:ATP synthase I n=1 Tax=Bacillus selenitireducens (strain ATCC 700615 / DSM 15326 / MLS10) TaxID=439292 RepID=D6Y0S3_BACIE|nr:ATP synthase subunit I [Salisediminibacterium selenitireducens]ADI00641.1 ATP synthase I [[Bacillus] selenitireducens MLS10]
MNDIRKLFIRYAAITIVLAVVFLLMIVFGGDRPFWTGLAFGTSFSLISLWMTYAQVSRIGKMTADRKPRPTLGTLSRLLVFLFAIWLAQQVPHYLSLTGVILGLTVTYVILLIEPLFHIRDLKETK